MFVFNPSIHPSNSFSLKGMAAPIGYSQIDDKDLDDAALWAVIDSATSKSLAINYHNPSPISKPSSRAAGDGEVEHEPEHEPWSFRPPRKVPRICSPDAIPLPLVKNGHPTPPSASSALYSPPHIGSLPVQSITPYAPALSDAFSGNFPSVSLFKEYQTTAMAILEKTDYTLISGRPFIKKSGWRKISCFFNISFEIRDKNIEFDDNRNVQRAEFVVRAYMQGGRFSDGWGSCERREKRFQKPNHDVPSTAETRAKNKACQDLLGIGEYRSGDMASSVGC